MAHLKGRLQRSRAGNRTGLSGGEGPGARPATPTAPADATLSSGTTYTVVATPAGTTLRLDATTADAEDTGGATGWSLADEYDWRNSSNMWTTNVIGKSLRVAIKGPTVQVPAAVSDVVVAPVPRPPTRCKSPGPLPMTRGGIT